MTIKNGAGRYVELQALIEELGKEAVYNLLNAGTLQAEGIELYLEDLRLTDWEVQQLEACGAIEEEEFWDVFKKMALNKGVPEKEIERYIPEHA